MKLRLFYFDARGRGELTRLILAYGKLEYEVKTTSFLRFTVSKKATPVWSGS